MKRWTKRVLFGISGIIAAICGTVVYADWDWGRPIAAPYPQIHADTSADAVRRGGVIFKSTCAACHVPGGGDRAVGAPMTEAPAFLGRFHAANITSDRTAGAGALEDAQIARALRYGVGRNSKHIAMPALSMSDADIAAVIGFMRSDDPLFRPEAALAPRSELSLLGKTMLFLTGATKAPNVPAQGITSPAKAATAAYGDYLTHSVYACADCHTPGFGADKASGAEAFTGGFEFRDSQGRPVYSANLTPDESGIAHHDGASFRRAVRDGQHADGSPISPPMPQFKGMDDVELDAIYTYLRSLPKHRSAQRG